MSSICNSATGTGAARWHCLAVVAALALACTCSADNPDALPRTNLITGHTGSSWYRIGSAIAEKANVFHPGHPLTAIPGAGGVSNPARIGLVPGDLGLSFLPFLRAAREGRTPYREAYPELRHVATLLRNKLHVCAAADLGLTRVSDLATLPPGSIAVGTGPPGSGEEFLLRESLEAIGLGYDQIRSSGGRIEVAGSGERADLFRDQHISIFVSHTLAPSSVITELMLSRESRLLSVDPPVRNALFEKWAVPALTIPAGSYSGQEEIVDTVGLSFAVFTTADVDDRLVYSVVQGIAENRSFFLNVHPGFRDWQPERMADSGGVPFHPGAERYYRERGWIE
ncbi:MAG TPA: TAXI family TRAP transporter solute-binding subunit [Acidobacteriota bacterium]|nr:TAXI family TRAP transporter solute-binding subunit [Acidobacteriota bacterium]